MLPQKIYAPGQRGKGNATEEGGQIFERMKKKGVVKGKNKASLWREYSVSKGGKKVTRGD